MDSNNWKPNQTDQPPQMGGPDWRTQFHPDSRQRVVNKIMDTLKRHLPFSGQEGLQELKKIVVRFEEKIYSAATSQSDYLRKISLKMLTMESKSQNTLPNALSSNSAGAGVSRNPQDSASLDATAQTGTKVGDWQEEVYQRVKAMKQQVQNRHITRHLLQKNQILQQQSHLQQAKQQQTAQMQIHQMAQLHQINDVNELKMRQGMGPRSGPFPQFLSSAQRYAQQLKPGISYPISSPQLVQAESPQINQHSSPQIDQINLPQSVSKSGTPLQSTNSPFVPSPSTPLQPSPIPGEFEKPQVSSLSVNTVQQQTSAPPAALQSLSIGTPRLSASPFLDFTAPDGALGNASIAVSGKSCVTEQPLERLLKAVKSSSPKPLNASVSDIESVVNMIDRIAGSAPGNGSRATVGEDLVAMTKCRLQTKNFLAQDGSNGTKRMRRFTSALPLNIGPSLGSMNDSLKQLVGSETSEVESSATSSVKKARVESDGCNFFAWEQAAERLEMVQGMEERNVLMKENEEWRVELKTLKEQRHLLEQKVSKMKKNKQNLKAEAKRALKAEKNVMVVAIVSCFCTVGLLGLMMAQVY